MRAQPDGVRHRRHGDPGVAVPVPALATTDPEVQFAAIAPQQQGSTLQNPDAELSLRGTKTLQTIMVATANAINKIAVLGQSGRG
jgi:hypothetical protein